MFEHRLKTVARSRVGLSEVDISFSRTISRTNVTANLPLLFTFFDDCLIHITKLSSSRLDTIDDIGEKKLCFSSLLTIASEYETLELFVFEDSEHLFNFSGDRVQKKPISYVIIGYQSLENLYETIDEGIDDFRREVIELQKEDREVDAEGYAQAMWDWTLSFKDLWSQEFRELTLGML